MLEASTARLITIPGLGRTYFPGSDDFTRIGTHWLMGTTAGNGHPTLEYLNWHSGQVRDFGEESGAPSVPRDLNSSGLDAIGPRGVFFVFARQGSLTVFERAGLRQSPLLLRRRQRAAIPLDLCPRTCTAVSIGARLITWASGSTASAYAHGTHKRLAWRFARSISQPLNGLDAGVQQTAHFLFFNVPLKDSNSTGFRILTTRAPP